jgi:hypothetical protein
MDPQATWLALIQALIDEERESASEYAEILIDWLDRGGFPPIVLSDLGQAAHDRNSPAYRMNRMVVLYACAIVRIGT